jgi:hypothetical protein
LLDFLTSSFDVVDLDAGSFDRDLSEELFSTVLSFNAGSFDRDLSEELFLTSSVFAFNDAGFLESALGLLDFLTSSVFSVVFKASLVELGDFLTSSFDVVDLDAGSFDRDLSEDGFLTSSFDVVDLDAGSFDRDLSEEFFLTSSGFSFNAGLDAGFSVDNLLELGDFLTSSDFSFNDAGLDSDFSTTLAVSLLFDRSEDGFLTSSFFVLDSDFLAELELLGFLTSSTFFVSDNTLFSPFSTALLFFGSGSSSKSDSHSLI